MIPAKPRKSRSLHLVMLVSLMTAMSVSPVMVADLLLSPGPTELSSESPFNGCTAEDSLGQPGTLVPNSEVEPWLVVNPTNRSNLVALWAQDWWAPPTQGARGMVAGVSFDGGKKWERVVIPGLTLCSMGGVLLRTGDPWLTFAPNGDLYLAALGKGVTSTSWGPPSIVYVSKSTNGGLTWGLPTAIINDTGAEFFNDKESITADPADANFVYAVWTRMANGGKQEPAFFARTTDGGRTWEPPRKIYDPGNWNGTTGNQIVVLPDGTLLNFFTELRWNNDPGGGYHYDLTLSLIRSRDRGKTWDTQPKPIRVVAQQHACAGGNAEQLNCVTDPETGQRIRDAAALFDVAVDPRSGTLYLQWTDGRFSGGQFQSVAFSMSRDGGFTWSTPIKVNRTPADIPPGNQQTFGHSIHVADDGTIGVAYYDFRFNDANPGLPTDYWLVQCRPDAPSACADPADWSNETRLTGESFDMEKAAPAAYGLFVGDYQGMTADGTDFLAVWGQPHGDDPDNIYFRRVSIQLQGQVGSEVIQSDGQVWDESAGSIPSAGGEGTPCGPLVCKGNKQCFACCGWLGCTYACTTPNRGMTCGG